MQPNEKGNSGTAHVGLFNFHEKQVRSLLIDGEPWFVAKDVCDVLGLTNSRKSLMALDGYQKGVTVSNTPGGNQEVAIINESGVYSLIFKSRKPEARFFERWVTTEVLPTIRRTGRYGTAADGQVSYGTYVVNNHAVRYVEMNGVRWSYLRDVCMAGGSHRPRIKPYTNQPYSQRMALVGIRGEVWCANPEGVTLVLERRRISGAQLSLFVGLSEKGGES